MGLPGPLSSFSDVFVLVRRMFPCSKLNVTPGARGTDCGLWSSPLFFPSAKSLQLFHNSKTRILVFSFEIWQELRHSV